jgi:hypothetical protein
MGARPLVAAALKRDTVPGVVASQGYVIGGANHKLGCRCRACGMIRRRARERAIHRALFTFHC